MASEDREQKVLEGAAYWASFYRANPHRFIKDYLHVNLRLFQKIILNEININTQSVIICSRGASKSFLQALYSVFRAILYPGSMVVIAGSNKSQANNVLEKIINELIPRSPELKAEISSYQMNGTNSIIRFKNTSYIKGVVSNDGSRGNRSTCLQLDEFPKINKAILDDVLKKFLTQKRMPTYSALTEAERQAEWDKEKNKTIYSSSAWYSDHWSYELTKSTAKHMLSGDKQQFVCGLPYQISVKENLIDTTVIENELADPTSSSIKFQIEMLALFFGSNEHNFFSYADVAKNRTMKYPMMYGQTADLLGNCPQIRIPPKKPGEFRLISADIALMASSKSKKNDATAIWIGQMLPTKSGRYFTNIVYGETHEGLRTEQQALMIRRLYEIYECDLIVIDSVGISMGIIDQLTTDIVDNENSEIYPALSCVNNKDIAARCTTPGAEKKIWAIKGNPEFNSQIAILLRDSFISGRIRLLQNEYEGEENLEELKGYNKLSPSEKMRFQQQYINQTLLVSELTALRHEEYNNRIRIKEKSNNRKDRYSSLAYLQYVALQIEQKERKKRSAEFRPELLGIIKPPKSPLTKGGRTHGKKTHHQSSWRD